MQLTDAQTTQAPTVRDPHINFAYLDERTKRMIRRAILKAVAKCPLVRARCRFLMDGGPAAFRSPRPSSGRTTFSR